MVGRVFFTDVLWRGVSTVIAVVAFAVVVYLIWTVFNNPPRPAGMYNLARAETDAVIDAFREMIGDFWFFYGGDMEAWWGEMVASGEALGVCKEWLARGARAVFNPLYLDANPKGASGGGADVRGGFYAFPGRDMSSTRGLTKPVVDELRIGDGSGKWPRISGSIALADGSTAPYSPGDDAAVWFDLDAFDPRQEVRFADPEYDVGAFVNKMSAVERHDLMACALPRFVRRLWERSAGFRHVPVSEIDSVVCWLASRGTECPDEQSSLFDDPESLPDVVLRLGVLEADPRCVSLAMSRLESTVSDISCIVHSRVVDSFRTSSAALAVLAVPDDDLLDAAALERKLAEALNLGDDARALLLPASRAMKAMRDVASASAALVDSAGLASADDFREFVALASPMVEASVKDLDEFMRATAPLGSPFVPGSNLDILRAWHRCSDVLRAAFDDTVRDAVEHLRSWRHEEAAPDVYRQYLNALNCAAYLQGGVRNVRDTPDGVASYLDGYLDDAMKKHNSRHINPLASKNFYDNYLKDLWQAFFVNDRFSGIPPRDCSDCFEPHIGVVSGAINAESIVEFHVRYWQTRSGLVGRQLVDSFMKSVKAGLRKVLLDCEFSVAFVRKILGDDLDGGGGYLGGGVSTIFSYYVQHLSTKFVYDIPSASWTDKDAPLWKGLFANMPVAGNYEFLFEQCVTGGTIIYMQTGSGYKYLAVLESGVIQYRNFSLDEQAWEPGFNVCGYGHQGYLTGIGDMSSIDANTVPSARRIPVDNKNFGQTPIIETFGEGDGEDYCESDPEAGQEDDGDGDSAAPDTSALFQVIHVKTDRLGSGQEVKHVVIISRSHRNKEAEKKRLLTVARNSLGRGELVVVDDTPANRSRAVVRLTSSRVRSTSHAALIPAIAYNYSYSTALAITKDNMMEAQYMHVEKGSGSIGPIRTIGIKKQRDNRFSGWDPFKSDWWRMVLVLEKPGLFPRFSIVPKKKPSVCVGLSSMDSTDATIETRFTPRGKSTDQVVLVPADNNYYPDIITKINATDGNYYTEQRGVPYFLFSPESGRFFSATPNPVSGLSYDQPGLSIYWIKSAVPYTMADVAARNRPPKDVHPWFIHTLHQRTADALAALDEGKE